MPDDTEKVTIDQTRLRKATDLILDAVLPITSSNDFAHAMVALNAVTASIIAKWGAPTEEAGIANLERHFADVRRLYDENRVPPNQNATPGDVSRLN